LARLHAERGLTLVLVSHDIGMVTRHVTHLACLNRRLFYHGDIDGFFRSVDLRQVYGDMRPIAHAH
ncbi:MAG TPA: metal ABC transporter ATP-binding protein, partial [Bacillota bacterium]